MALRDAVLVLGVVIGTRLLMAYTAPYVVRVLDRRSEQRARRVRARQRFVTAWAGPRGAVSLAAALAVPRLTDDGAPFPDRDLIVFTTFVVIAGTLVLQGLTLDRVMRWSRLPLDTARSEELELAERTMAEAAHASLEESAQELHSSPAVVRRLQRTYADAHSDDESDYRALRLALLGVKRAALVRLRDERSIDDIVLTELQVRLDREEVTLRPDVLGD